MAMTRDRHVHTKTSGHPAKGGGVGHGNESIVGGRGNVVAHAVLVVWALTSTVPLLWAVASAFKTDAEIFSSPWKLPSELRWDNFSRAWTEAHIGQYFVNSLIVVSGGVFLTLLLASMTAYVLARFRFRGSRVIYYGFAAGMMFPVFLALVPLFFAVQNLGLISTYHGLILVYTAYSLPFAVFFLTAFFRTLPTSLAEQALIDGCTQEGAFFRIMLPMAKPGLVSVGIFVFISQWNQYLLPLLLTTEEDRYVLALGLAKLSVTQEYQADWSALFAGLVISLLPVVAVYAVFHRKIQAGLTVGAFK